MSEMVEVVIDSIRVSLMSQQRIVILREVDAERYLPIWIGTPEAESITIALQEVEAQTLCSSTSLAYLSARSACHLPQRAAASWRHSTA